MRYIPPTLNDVFSAGMDRPLPDIIPFAPGTVLNLGAGRKQFHDTVPLDADLGWSAPALNFPDDSVGGALAFHFLEHLCKDDVLILLSELQRVFRVGASLVAVTPYAGYEMAFQDLDHKSFWNLGTFNNLFNNPYYDGTMPRGWKFHIHINCMMAVAERNMALVSQIVRTE